MEGNSFLPPVGSGPDIKIVDADETGFAALDAETFMKLLIAQLKNQDPLEPLDNSELLSQLSMMRNLTANIELAESIEQITANRQLNDGANFLGFDGSIWKALDVQATSGGGWTEDGPNNRVTLTTNNRTVGIGTTSPNNDTALWVQGSGDKEYHVRIFGISMFVGSDSI